MRTIELFAGIRSFSKVTTKVGYDAFTTDIAGIDGQDLIADVRSLTGCDLPHRPDILWASPPCEGFSVAAIGRNWTRANEPKTYTAKHGLELISA